MIFTETELAGAFVVDLERHTDERGSSARIFSQDDFREHGLEPLVAQANVGYNRLRGTLRGMHFQYPPAAETKYLRCTRGGIFVAIVDLRPESPSYLRHTSVELSAENGRGLYIPRRFANGYQTLFDDSETTYLIGEFYSPRHEGGLRYDDPLLGIDWPLRVTQLSPKDAGWRPLVEAEDELVQRMTVKTAV